MKPERTEGAMSDNDKYTNEKHGTFTPIGVILVIAVCVLVAIFVFTWRSGGYAPPSAPTSAPAATGTGEPNPNQLAPAPVPGQSPTAP